MPRAVVTGASGFLGHHIVQSLLRRGWSVTAIVRQGSYVAALRRWGVTLAGADFAHSRSVSAAMPQMPDVVIHAAAEPPSSPLSPEVLENRNVAATRSVLAAAQIADAGRIVHVSDSCVYNWYGVGEVCEMTPRLPDAPTGYIRSKLRCEEHARRTMTRGMDVVIVQPNPMFGPFQTHGLAYQAFASALGQKVTPISNAGTCLAHPQAVADAIVTAAESGAAGQSYLLGGEPIDFRTFAGLIAQATGGIAARGAGWPYLREASDAVRILASRVSKAPFCASVVWREWLERAPLVDDRLARSALSYRPLPMMTAVRDMVHWMQALGILEPLARAARAAEPDFQAPSFAPGAGAAPAVARQHLKIIRSDAQILHEAAE